MFLDPIKSGLLHCILWFRCSKRKSAIWLNLSRNVTYIPQYETGVLQTIEIELMWYNNWHETITTISYKLLEIHGNDIYKHSIKRLCPFSKCILVDFVTNWEYSGLRSLVMWWSFILDRIHWFCRFQRLWISQIMYFTNCGFHGFCGFCGFRPLNARTSEVFAYMSFRPVIKQGLSNERPIKQNKKGNQWNNCI